MTQPAAEFVHRRRRSAGQDLNPAVSQVARVAGDAQPIRDLRRAGAEEDTLNTPLYQASAADFFGHFGELSGARNRQRSALIASAMERAWVAFCLARRASLRAPL